MHASTTRDVVYSQCCLFFFWAVCIALEPRFLLERDEGGLSNFGVHARTVVPYSLAFLLPALLIARAALAIDEVDTTARRFRRILLALAWLLLAVLVSTYCYKLNVELRDLHIGVAIAMLCFETAASAWIALAVTGRLVDRVLLGVQVAGLVIAALTLVGVLHLLFLAQLVTSAAFGALLVRGALALEHRGGSTAHVPAQ
jgi:hypothetical protein